MVGVGAVACDGSLAVTPVAGAGVAATDDWLADGVAEAAAGGAAAAAGAAVVVAAAGASKAGITALSVSFSLLVIEVGADDETALELTVGSASERAEELGRWTAAPSAPGVAELAAADMPSFLCSTSAVAAVLTEPATAVAGAVACSASSLSAAFCAFAFSCAWRRSSAEGSGGRMVGEIDSGCCRDGTGSPLPLLLPPLLLPLLFALARMNPGQSTSPLASDRSEYKLSVVMDTMKVDADGGEGAAAAAVAAGAVA